MGLGLAVALASTTLAAGAGAPQLSTFWREPGGQMAWIRIDPLSRSKDLVAKVQTRNPIDAAWSPDGREGCLWADSLKGDPRLDLGARPPAHDFRDPHQHFWAVDFQTKAVRPFPPPPTGKVLAVGFDPDGKIVALTASFPPPGAKLRFDVISRKGETYRQYTLLEGSGTTYPIIGQNGDWWPDILSAWRWDGNGWRLAEARAVALDHDGGVVLAALSAYRTLWFRTGHPYGSEAPLGPVTGSRIKSDLQRLLPRNPFGGSHWAQLSALAGPVYFYRFTVDSDHLTPYAFLRVHGTLRLLPGGRRPGHSLIDGSADIDLRISGHYLLMTSAWDELNGVPIEGRPTGARLYDLRTMRLVFSSDEAQRVRFWPK